MNLLGGSGNGEEVNRMFDIESFIVEDCDDCGTRHAPIRGCPEEANEPRVVVLPKIPEE